MRRGLRSRFSGRRGTDISAYLRSLTKVCLIRKLLTSHLSLFCIASRTHSSLEPEGITSRKAMNIKLLCEHDMYHVAHNPDSDDIVTQS